MATSAGPLRSWHEPDPRPWVPLLLGAALGGCLVVMVSSSMFGNWDLAAGVAVVAGACGFDLWRGLRPRQLVVAGPDGLVFRLSGRTTTFLPWEQVTGFREHARPWGRSYPVVQRTDGSELRLPAGAPVEDLRHWWAELRSEDGPPR